MPTITINKTTPSSYVLKAQKEESDQTQFMIKPLTGLEHMEVLALADAGDQGQMIYAGKSLKLALMFGLKGWENLCDQDGKAIEFNRLNIDLLPPLDLHELAQEILTRSELTSTERKNS